MYLLLELMLLSYDNSTYDVENSFPAGTLLSPPNNGIELPAALEITHAKGGDRYVFSLFLRFL